MGEFAVEHAEQFSAKTSSLIRGQVIAYPQRAAWIGLIRRPIEAAGLRLTTPVALQGCRDELARCPSCLFVLELTADGIRQQLEFVTDICERLPGVRTVVVAKQVAAASELMLRELGVCDVLRSVRDFGQLTHIAQTHASQHVQQPNDLISELLRNSELV
jgi:hypothetical protein